jgi:hypothetical protein
VLIAYVVLSIQILGFASFDIGRAAAVIEASSISALLLTVPALTLLPAIAYAVAVSAFLYVTGKLKIFEDGTRGRVGTVVAAASVLPLILTVAVLLFLPLGAAIILLASLLRFLIDKQAFKAIWATSKLFVRRLPSFLPRLIRPSTELPPINEDARLYLTEISHAALAVTDIWNGDLEPEQRTEQLRKETETTPQRRRIGSLLAGAGLVALLSAFVPRPWMPARQFVTTEPDALGCHGRAIAGSQPARFRITGFLVGQAGERVTVMSLDHTCVLTLDANKVIAERICQTNPRWFLRPTVAVLGLTDADHNPPCS